MPALFVFLLKVNAALLLFCAGYYLVLRHLTFYTLNRVYLMGAIVFATVYPQINLNAFFQRHQQLAQPVYVVVDNLHLPAQVLAQPVYWTWLEIIFFAGVVILAIKLFAQLYSLYKVYRASQKGEILGHNVRVVNGDGGPFSFWKSIYVNPTGYTDEDLRAILKHEQIHTDEWHTLDILLAELSVVFYWFNPGVWLMRKAVRENIEFITDRKILQQGADTKQYQYSLLNVSITNTKPGIANHFNISTLKKRILMMNAKRSSNINLTRYAFLVPVLLVMLLSFSITRAAIVKTSKLTYKTIITSVDQIVNDSPVTNRIEEIFGEPKKSAVVEKRKDTVKIIRVNRKDTISIISNTAAVLPEFQLNYSNDSTKSVHVLNFNLDTNVHKITHVRINGRDYLPDAEKKIFIAVGDSNQKASFKIDTATKMRRGMPIILNINGKQSTANFSFDAKNTSDSATQKIAMLINRMEGFKVAADGSVTRNGKSYQGRPLDAITVVGHPLGEGIDFSNKLIIIDGVEATAKDMKKLPGTDLRTLIHENGPGAVKQYGEKAKNGVIIITTKKAKP